MHVTAETGMQEAVLGTYRESDLDEIYEMLSSRQMDLKNGKGTIAAARMECSFSAYFMILICRFM